ncbi:MAG: NAD-dependent succinate-semialdehyde dehydrogenase [Myxococcota bacterium]
MKAIDPSTGEVIREYEALSWEQARDRIEASHRAFTGWRERSFAERAQPMRRAAAVLRERRDEYAELMAREMGKPLGSGRSEVEKCAWVCEHYAEHAEDLLAPRPVRTDASRSYVAFRPLGVVFAVMPWNFPFWQVFRFAAPSLMAGNGAVLKHAENVPGCALAIEDVFRRAGFPDDLFASLLVGRDMAPKIIEHPRVVAVTLTGSTRAGRAVASKAGEALKKTVLELGGSDPYVVLEDADLDEAVATCVQSRLLNGGQSCIAAKRFVVVRPVLEAFQSKMVERMRAVEMGSPFDEGTELGPQARTDLRDDLHRQVRESIEAGATRLLGGEVPDRPGAWYPPTVLANVGPDMPAYREELFGPVAAILAAEDEDGAIRIANDSQYGLGAAVFARDPERGERIARERLDAGNCFVNSLVRSDPRLPFGGVKESGYGRELGAFGILEFVNIKTVYIG